MVLRFGSCDLCKMPMDVHLVVKYAVHHSNAVLAPSFFQCFPVLRVNQRSYTAVAIIAASNTAGKHVLNHFNFVGIALIACVPHW